MQTILDIDLDFFLDNVEYFDTQGRLDSELFHPWPVEDLEGFLVQRCKLSTDCRKPDRVLTYHDEAFHFWEELIAGGQLTPPFSVVHVDAHGDLSFLDLKAVEYLYCDLLQKNIADRVRLARDSGHINKGNYLLFAIACGWIDNLTFVLNPHSLMDDNIPPHVCPGDDVFGGQIQLRKCNRGQMKRMNPYYFRWQNCTIGHIDPILFQICLSSSWSFDGHCDFIVLSKSPNFTPETADALIPVIQQYINPI